MLQKIKSLAEKHLAVEIKDAFVTVPTCFDSEKIKAAGKIIGLNIQTVINKPTAAAIAYSENFD